MRLTFDLDDRHARAATFAIHEYDRYPNYQQRTTHIAGRPAVLYTCEDPLERFGGRYVHRRSASVATARPFADGMMVSKFPDGHQAAVDTFATLTFP
jgi:hypothetical protein